MHCDVTNKKLLFCMIKNINQSLADDGNSHEGGALSDATPTRVRHFDFFFYSETQTFHVHQVLDVISMRATLCTGDRVGKKKAQCAKWSVFVCVVA